MSDKIITLVGSTRFKPLFEFVNRELTFRGWLVFTIEGTYAKHERPDIAQEIANHIRTVCRVHKRKIAHSRAIFVIDGLDGYTGDHTRSEIAYAKRHGKDVFYFSRNDFGMKYKWIYEAQFERSASELSWLRRLGLWVINLPQWGICIAKAQPSQHRQNSLTDES